MTSQTDISPAAARRWPPSRAVVIDFVVMGVLAALGLASRLRPVESPFTNWLDPWSFLLFALATTALVVRRKAPGPVWAATLALAALDSAISSVPSPALLAVFVAQYTVAAHASGRAAVATGLATAGVLTLDGLLFAHWPTASAYGIAGWVGMATAIGVAIRNQRAVVAAAEERARRAEATREEEAERRVAEERVRIARELHDVVAHHIAVINVQAGVARHLLDSKPEEARKAIGIVRDSSGAVMAELSAIVGLLRTREEAGVVQPAPGLARLDELLSSARHAGLSVELATVGEQMALPPLVDLTAYRIVQESLTNAQRHGAGAASLRIEYANETASLDIVNEIGRDEHPTDRRGYGLIGMRERVAAVGGQLEAGPTGDGRFRVHAELPATRA